MKVLIVLSDGRPLDDGYTAWYAIEDTSMALKEASRLGIHPFCVTVDRGADSYLASLYGDVRYAVIDDVRELPQRLPSIYRRLTT